MKMENRYHSLLLAVLLTGIFSITNVFGQELNFNVLNSQKDWDEALVAAKSNNKDIFLDIYAVWCGPCKMMDSDVYTVPEVGNYYNSNYINLKIDGESEFGEVLARKYNLSAYPSLYFINSDEGLIYESVGYSDGDALVKKGKLVKESGKRYNELTTKFNLITITEPEKQEFIDLLVKFENTELLATLAEEKIKTFTTEDILNPVNKDIIVSYSGELKSLVVQTVLNNASTLEVSWGPEDLNQFLSNAFDKSMNTATQMSDSTLMEALVNQLVPIYLKSNPERIPEAQLTTRKIYYSQIEEWNNYINSVETYYQTNQKDVRFLYGEAYYVIENQMFYPELLGKSIEWLEKVIAVEPDFDSYFLIAIVNTYNENPDAARSWMAKAESVADTDDERNSIEELKNYLDSL